MDSIKKLLVLAAGVLLVMLAANIVHQTQKTQSVAESPPPSPRLYEEPQTFQPGPELRSPRQQQPAVEDSSKALEMPEAQGVAEDVEAPDSVEKTAADPVASTRDDRPLVSPLGSDTPRVETGTDPRPPVISGALPGTGNPNPIFVSAAQRILPAVVSIRSVRQVNGKQFNLFHRWFGPGGEENDSDEDGNNLLPGAGSGILVSADGYILTNHHVVEEADEVRVTLHDKREFTARIIGSDPTTDVAALKIDGSELPFAELGDSDDIRIGEWVMAVGNPLEFRSTVTAGIVSALRRDIQILRERFSIENFIQTDAVINPGNSGGALVNLDGAVIGVNTAIATRNGYYQGYGFAIPINLAKKVLGDLIQYGRVRRALLGISIAEVSDQVARSVGLELPQGALIQSVQEGYPAAEAGLQAGDVVLKVNGNKINSVNDLQTRVAEQKPGDRVRLEVWRDRSALQLDIELAEAPGGEEQTVSELEEAPGLQFQNLGMVLSELTDEQKDMYEVRNGVYVKRVVPESPANRAGVTARSVILTVDGERVKSISDVEEQIEAAQPSDIMKIGVIQFSIDDEIMERILFLEVP